MSGNYYLNGGDYLMAGFDYELRKRGFAGNSCQVVLELNRTIPIDVLQMRVAALAEEFPILNSRTGGIIRPRWKFSHRAVAPVVRKHHDAPNLREKIFNEPLDAHRGELLRFDIIESDGGRASLVFTWAHTLMDAPGAEHLLACIGRGEKPPGLPSQNGVAGSKLPLKQRFKQAWKYIYHLDKFCKAAPKSMGCRFPNAAATLKYHVEKFSAAETETIRANGARLCGMLADAQFHAVVSMMELHRLRERVKSPSPSYVLPVPVGLRRKGNIEPLFSNQVGMLMFQFLPEQLTSITDAVAALKSQTTQAMRDGLLESGRTLAEMFRFLPMPIFVAMLKQGLRGEICSLFYGDTAAVHPQLNEFLGATVEDFAHVAAVTPTPGIGVIFYYFRNELRLTVLHSAQVLDESEAASFTAGLRNRLLNP